MAFYDKFPYTNFHELNTDWIIQKIKSVEDSEAHTEELAEAAQASANASAASASASDQSAQASAASAEAAGESEAAAALSAAGIEAARQQIYTNTARLDNLIVDGTPTEGNTELLDIRVGGNGITYPTAGDAVRGQYDELNQAIGMKLNIPFTSALFTAGTYINTAGEVRSNNRWKASNFIDISEVNTDYFFYGKFIESTSACMIAFYDENEDFISGIPGTVNNALSDLNIPELPAGTKYIRLTFANSADFPGYLDQSFHSGKFTDKTVVNNLISKYAGKNLTIPFNDGRFIARTYINTEGAATTISRWKATDFIDISGYDPEEFYFEGMFIESTQACRIAFYDENQDFISGVPGEVDDRLSYLLIDTVPAGTKYIRLTFANSADFPGYLDQTFNSGKYITKKVLDEKIKFNLNNKKWAVLGDSRSAYSHGVSKKYFNYIADFFPALTIENKAVSGSRMADQYTYAQSISAGADLISCYVGVNDWGQNDPTPLGTFSDQDTDNTFYGYTKKLINYLVTTFPAAHIFFITPMPEVGFSDFPVSGDEANSLGFTIYDYINAIKECCERYSIPVYDNASEGGYTPFIAASRTRYFIDGLHENANGQNLLGMRLLPYLQSHFTE